MTYNTMIVEKKNQIATITLNRPPMNAVNEELLNELVEVCDDLEKDNEIQVVILTGAGKAFSAGRELPGVLAGEEYPGGPRYRTLENLSKPVIAAVNGYCFTGSFELAMCADIIIASEKAVFSDTHARFGLIPGGGQTQRLPRLIGVRKAKELLFTCDRISANEAEKIGIVNKVVPPEELEEAAREMAEKILKNIPESVSTIKKLINQSLNTDLESGLKLEQDRYQGRPITPVGEGRKRIQAFAEKK
ncbi:MAG: enoyl-CoA hydratase/isomerase family protein [Deltaproteobacteria bacterium]|nr:enoyl-CoA hydratase/isomerase family protein [Deltaproteobacteria bacterium]MBW2051390.1 enoyl-CoA hydratase/isomerase family protein [Deltaproteobacteria bacterium]MBW2142207.1 enoyl-CoA hydratase/isomerase family protein [Deltaproteobacteria bacterium]MBW2322737.1 enoyl-CoA hydratase/isomerase family protein [Deltaproteobacteria bacterium]